MTEIKLGLCNPPEPIYLYVKNGELSGESYLWYRYDINNNETIPVSQTGLTGYLSELRLTTKEFKGKDNVKLDIVVRADEIYVVRTGIETNFAKTFLLAASLVEDFSKPLVIAATAGEENVVFCRLYDAHNKTRFRAEWNKDADWATIISSIQSKLSGRVSQPQNLPHLQDLRIREIRTLLNYPVDLVKEYLRFQDVERPSQLDISKVNELVKTMCLAWAADKVEHPNHVESSYQQQVLTDSGDEIATIKAWMNYILGQRIAVSSGSRKQVDDDQEYDPSYSGHPGHPDNYGDR